MTMRPRRRSIPLTLPQVWTTRPSLTRSRFARQTSAFSFCNMGVAIYKRPDFVGLRNSFQSSFLDCIQNRILSCQLIGLAKRYRLIRRRCRLKTCATFSFGPCKEHSRNPSLPGLVANSDQRLHDIVQL